MEIKLTKGDITKITVDVIVNAANTSLLGGGGVDGAIHRAGGKAILEECMEIRNRQGGCPVGEAVMTTAGDLLAQKLIHTVGPRWNGGSSGEAEKLQNCYLNSLVLADAAGFTSIAFPNISTGVYRSPKWKAANIALGVIKAYQANSLNKVLLVCFDEENHRIYQEVLRK